jgi:tricorn protease
MRVLLLLPFATSALAAAPLLLQRPAVSEKHIVFSYAADLWSVPRSGGDAIRLTAGQGLETDPHFSPDGTQIAFTGEYEGNLDVYVMPAAGGVPKRLTWHPAEDYAVGWTRDGKRILLRSRRDRNHRLYTVSTAGGPAEELPLERATYGDYSPDGTQIAYMPLGFRRPANFHDAWKRYRGGRTTPIWIAQLSDSSVTKVTRDNSNDSHPMWIGGAVYFLSDRNGPTTLYSWDAKTRRVTQVLPPGELDIKWATAGPGAIVYERFGEIRLYDIEAKKDQAVPVRVAADLTTVRPRMVPAAKYIRSAAISPSGVRAVFEARGEIVSVPVEKGDARNLTNTPGVHERTPAWSPDGKWIAYWTDADGEYNLHLRAQNAAGDPKVIVMPERGFYFQPHWSPDSKKLTFTDNKLNLWVIDIEKNTHKKIATDTYYDPTVLQSMDPAWSPDSRWIAYTKKLRNHLRAVFLYSIADDKTHPVTDGMSDARDAQFDRDGKYLYFSASTDAALTPHWLDMSSNSQRSTRSVYLTVLRRDLPSPLAPESDEEKAIEAAKEEKKDEKKEPAPAAVTIDFEDIGQRILALPIPARDYRDLIAGKAGILYAVEGTQPIGGTAVVHKFDLKTRKTEKLLDGVTSFQVSASGEKMLFRQADKYTIAAAAAAPKPGEGILKTEAIEVLADPRAEWKQMYRDVWRIQRDWFYDPKYHGLDLERQAKRYEPFVESLGSRAELNYLFQEMLGDITVGHLYIGGGEFPELKPARVGLLGADYTVENGRYRFARVFNGENWNPDLRAPLTQPGVNVKAGEYLLAVNGRDVSPSNDIYSYFEATAGKQTVLRVGADPGGAGAREVTVVPVEAEQPLRTLAWVEENRRKVDRMTNGRVAYVYLPNTGQGGYAYFNRYYFSQVGKEAAVIDERFNGGGQAADYIIDYLRRPLLNYWTTRYGEDFTTPRGAIFGPKVMIINEEAGSGGDALPWYFRRLKIGPLVGKRTWGGLVGILGFPVLMDGGTVTAPNLAFWSPDGSWDVENNGVAPDVEVEMDPKLVRQGKDPQLERAVAIVMEALEKSPLPKHKRPEYPNYHGQPQPSGAALRR